MCTMIRLKSNEISAKNPKVIHTKFSDIGNPWDYHIATLVCTSSVHGTMMNVNNSTATLTSTTSSLPDGVFTGTIAVMVTATSRYGIDGVMIP